MQLHSCGAAAASMSCRCHPMRVCVDICVHGSVVVCALPAAVLLKLGAVSCGECDCNVLLGRSLVHLCISYWGWQSLWLLV